MIRLLEALGEVCRTIVAHSDGAMVRLPAWLSCVVALGLVLGACGGSGGPTAVASPAAAGATVTIDSGVTYQTMAGFGTSERLWDDPHVVDAADPATGRGLALTPAQQDELLDRLYVDLGLTRVRPTLTPGLAPQPGAFRFTRENLDGHVDYVQRARARGLRTVWLSPSALEPWLRHDDPGAVADWALAVLARWRALGVEVPYYAVVNEPAHPRSGLWSGEELRDVIRALGPRLRAAGLATRIVVPDDLNPGEAYRRAEVILADEEARRYVGALAYHLYGGAPADRRRMADLAARYGLPVWMTEYAQPEGPIAWAATIQGLIAADDVSAVDALFGYFGAWDKPETHLITLRGDGARYQGYELTKLYYVTGQFSRFVRPGAQRVRVDDAGSGLKLTAYRDGGRVIVVAVNDGADERSVTIRLANERAAGQMTAVRTSATEDWAALPPVAVSAGAFSTTFPAGSVTTLTTGLGR